MAVDVEEIVGRIIARIHQVKKSLGDGFQFFLDIPPIFRGIADVVETIPELQDPIVLWQVSRKNPQLWWRTT